MNSNSIDSCLSRFNFQKDQSWWINLHKGQTVLRTVALVADNVDLTIGLLKTVDLCFAHALESFPWGAKEQEILAKGMGEEIETQLHNLNVEEYLPTTRLLIILCAD